MDITGTHVAAYVGASSATAVGLTALRHGSAPRALALGLATGVVAGGVQSYVHDTTGSSELGWGAAVGTGIVAGAALLGGLGRAGLTPMQARGIGAVIGGATGVFAPLAAGMVLAQMQPAEA